MVPGDDAAEEGKILATALGGGSTSNLGESRGNYGPPCRHGDVIDRLEALGPHRHGSDGDCNRAGGQRR